ncbi:hypothetical protein B0I35DRAFT_471898 [Stachybotrys elegans]|uniref:Major facilitator superfamily (MFS) profile domain-containing protein n=1 Tax=Stachybotrys elegans TaxID=80388 RepID=A0A8K0SJ19_9HYPO|nr:hypothetical protein B0I35DRAFT_471898 [Stachybotrys elegans]
MQERVETTDFKRGFTFWAIIAGISITSLQSSLEHSVVVTAGPAIVDDLAMGEEYIWITNASGICGGATNGSMLITGRGIQGAGSGGLVMISSVILGDLVPLRQRGYYIAIIMISYTLCMTAGPIEGTLRKKLRRVDYLGNGLLITGTISMLYSLTYAGGGSSWGPMSRLSGPCLFACWETWLRTRACHATKTFSPPDVQNHRHQHVPHWMLVYWGMYFLPVYFQVVRTFSASRTGVALLPMTILSIPSCAIVAALASHVWRGRFTVEWAAFQCICAIGAGIVLETLLPGFQAPVPEEDQATATSTWAFIRAVGGIWGVAVPATILNNRINATAWRISDTSARQLILAGRVYEHASARFVLSFPEATQDRIRLVYRDALRRVFLVAAGIGSLACVLFLLQQDVPFRENLETKYGLTDQSQEKLF